MTDKQRTENLQNMEEIMEKLGNRTDIWQDRFIYWIAKCLRDILIEKARGK